MEANKVIDSIAFPNTVADADKNIFTIKQGFDFEVFTKNGENAPVNWIRIYKLSEVFAEIKESVCDIYFVLIK